MYKALIGGLIGAVTVTLLNESLRKLAGNTPRLDKLGEEATAGTIQYLGGDPPSGDTLYATSMGADILSNMMYYSSAAASEDNPVLAGMGLGVLAGLGAVYIPEEVGLDPDHTAGTDQKKWLTIGMYTLGGIIAGAVIRRLSR